MKKSDIFTVIIIAAVGTLAAYFGVNALLGNANDATYSFKTIEVISAELAEPDPEVFNDDAINPTVEVYVGECEDIDKDGELSIAEEINCGDYGNVSSKVRYELERETDDGGKEE
ncbi:hypothetical protein IJ096_01015 [Candidatus Saccharibacteria bacterium]|nr:hypothetical protein [Candidatus Saccharibacteria bacterium]